MFPVKKIILKYVVINKNHWGVIARERYFSFFGDFCSLEMTIFKTFLNHAKIAFHNRRGYTATSYT